MVIAVEKGGGVVTVKDDDINRMAHIAGRINDGRFFNGISIRQIPSQKIYEDAFI
jgi:hypothetical protein